MKTARETEIRTTVVEKPNLTQAAVVIKSLPQWQAVNLLSRLDPADCFKVLAVVEQIDKITSEQLNASLAKLKHDTERWRYLNNSDKPSHSAHDSSRPLSAKGGQEIGEPPPEHSGKPFDYLIKTLPEVRTQLLENEHPKNIAIVLSWLPSDIASKCLESLDTSVRVSVIRRICELDDIDQKELSELNYVLRLRHQKLYRRVAKKSSGVQVAVEMLSQSDRETQQLILDLLEQSEPELASELERSLETRS